MEPKASTVLAVRASQAAGSVTSQAMAMARPPSRLMVSASSWHLSMRRAARATCMPARAQARAVAAPMPLEAPVMAMGLLRRSMAMREGTWWEAAYEWKG